MNHIFLTCLELDEYHEWFAVRIDLPGLGCLKHKKMSSRSLDRVSVIRRDSLQYLLTFLGSICRSLLQSTQPQVLTL